MKRALKSFTNENIVVCEFHLTKVKIPPEAEKYKQMNKQCYLLLISMVFLIFYSTELIAQDSSQTPAGFPLGVFSHIKNDPVPSTSIQLLEDAGINYIVDGINEITGNTSFNLMGAKKSLPEQYIFYYSKGYYTRWEAERDDYAFLVTGFKHPHPEPWGYGPYLYGEREYYNGAWCWATDSTSEFKIDSVLWGPNYRQDKNYTAAFSTAKIEYTADYRLALRYAEQYEDTTTVCRLTVKYRFIRSFNDVKIDTPTINLSEPLILRVENFSPNSFKTFSVIYQYPNRFGNEYLGKFPEEMYSEEDTTFIDDIELTGIEFQLDWYGVGKLYIDYVDLYDNIIGMDLQDEDFFESVVRPNLIDYANSYANVGNLKYWYVNDEPNTMDSYEPMRIVDSIVTEYASFTKPIITEIYPFWNGYLNGDLHLKKFVELTKPRQLMIDKYPFVDGYTTEWGLGWLRKAFQFASNAQPGFWYVGQGFSQRISGPGGEICRWRFPDSSELNASVMLALAHGVSGLMFWNYESYDTGICGEEGYFDCIVGMSPTYYPSELWQN